MSSDDIELGGQQYKFVKKRVYDTVKIYSGNGTFLRIGSTESITKHIGMHKRLLGHGFPVPKIIKEGVHDGEAFYVEESLGSDVIANDLHAEWKEGGVTYETFSKMLNVTQRFARAQLSTAKKGEVGEPFYKGIHMDCIVEERPEFEGEISKAYEKMKKNIAAYPMVLTHGDFNPFNFLENGVIDFEGSFEGPAGYDLIAGIYHGFLFPKGKEYEMQRMFEFDDEQVREYLKHMDEIYSESGLPAPSTNQDDYLLARTIFYATRMHVVPKVQKYGYALLETITRDYIKGKPITQTVKNFTL